LSRFSPYVDKIIGIISANFDVIDQLLIRYFAFLWYWRKNGVQWDCTSAIIDLCEAYDSVRREVLYNILIVFGIPRKPVRLIKMCLNETCSKIRKGKHLSGAFPVQNCLKQGDALSPLLFNFALDSATGVPPRPSMCATSHCNYSHNVKNLVFCSQF
jgi:hypothetical protein